MHVGYDIIGNIVILKFDRGAKTVEKKKFAERFLKKNKVSFKEKDVGKDKKAGEEMIKKSGQMGVPVTDANGEIIVGFNEAALKKALKLK